MGTQSGIKIVKAGLLLRVIIPVLLSCTVLQSDTCKNKDITVVTSYNSSNRKALNEQRTNIENIKIGIGRLTQATFL